MPKIVLIDFETTGVDPYKDRMTEFALCEYDPDTTETITPTTNRYVWEAGYPIITDEVSQLTGITQKKLHLYGITPFDAVSKIIELCPESSIMVAHNANNFDKIILQEEAKRQGLPLPQYTWVDTRTDIPYPERQRCKILSHICLDHGFVIDPMTLHRAEGDIQLLAMLLSKYDFDKILHRSTAKKSVISAKVTYDDRQLAKDAGFRWQELGTRVFPKRWVKEILEEEFSGERVKYSFQIELL
jgi:DNA polymerase III, epsilon subunit and related 3''-5'' exonucleases